MDKITDAVRMLMDRHDGHGFDHIERVKNLAVKFAEKEGADIEIVTLASLLHDADDYKLFGRENADRLINTNQILDKNHVDRETKARVLCVIKNMGYSKSLRGIRPKTIEGKVVSDADMCDAIGAEGILRAYSYGESNGRPFFDKTLSPLMNDDMTSVEYEHIAKNATTHSVQHFFDKLLKINSILLTSAGKEEGAKRQKIMIDFLAELFREEGAVTWSNYLTKYLPNLD